MSERVLWWVDDPMGVYLRVEGHVRFIPAGQEVTLPSGEVVAGPALLEGPFDVSCARVDAKIVE